MKANPHRSNNTKSTETKKALSSRQERFCEFVAAGESLTDAYIKAGFKTTRDNARKNAAKLTAKDGISARIRELREQCVDVKTARMTKQEKLDFLALVIRTPIGNLEPGSPLCAESVTEVEPGTGKILRRRVKSFDKLRAIELHSKLMGHFEPDRQELELGNQALMSIRERAKELGYAMSAAYKHGTPATLDD